MSLLFTRPNESPILILNTCKLGFGSTFEIDEANYLIGTIYLDGEVVNKDLEKARYYLELADSDKDHRSAQEILIIIGREKFRNKNTSTE